MHLAVRRLIAESYSSPHGCSCIFLQPGTRDRSQASLAVDVPHKNAAVCTGRHNLLSVRAELDVLHHATVPNAVHQTRPGTHVPQLHNAV